jgi:BlaI family penicillinase repressor
MPEPQRPEMSDAEREVLKVLWDCGPLTVRDAMQRLKDSGQGWARSTVITLLQRLEAKGYVASDGSQFAHVFSAAVTREEVMRDRMADLAGELCDGEALSLVLAFTEKHRFTPDELARFRQMIDDLEAKQTKRGKK